MRNALTNCLCLLHQAGSTHPAFLAGRVALVSGRGQRAALVGVLCLLHQAGSTHPAFVSASAVL